MLTPLEKFENLKKNGYFEQEGRNYALVEEPWPYYDECDGWDDEDNFPRYYESRAICKDEIKAKDNYLRAWEVHYTIEDYEKCDWSNPYEISYWCEMYNLEEYEI